MPHRSLPGRVAGAAVHRRAFLLGGLAVVGTTGLVAGCDASHEAPSPSAPITPTAEAIDEDSDLVERMGTAIAGTIAVAQAAGRANRSLRSRTAPLVRMHRAHLDELGWTGDEADAPTVKAGRASARLTRAEDELTATLTDGCLEAGSGALAQLLASMVAAIAQRQAVA